MKGEYKTGEEDIYLSVETRADGNVTLGIFLAKNDVKLYGVVLPPEVARKAAERLTLASWQAEDYKKKWQEGQRDE